MHTDLDKLARKPKDPAAPVARACLISPSSQCDSLHDYRIATKGGRVEEGVSSCWNTR